jgi:hypothetical protein
VLHKLAYSWKHKITIYIGVIYIPSSFPPWELVNSMLLSQAECLQKFGIKKATLSSRHHNYQKRSTNNTLSFIFHMKVYCCWKSEHHCFPDVHLGIISQRMSITAPFLKHQHLFLNLQHSRTEFGSNSILQCSALLLTFKWCGEKTQMFEREMYCAWWGYESVTWYIPHYETFYQKVIILIQKHLW